MQWHSLSRVPAPRRGHAPTPERDAAAAASLRVAGLDKCDARSIWAGVSNFRGYLRPRGSPAAGLRVPVAVEVAPDAATADRRALARFIHVRALYDTGPNGDVFWTGWVPASDLRRLATFPALTGWRVGLDNIAGDEGTSAVEPAPSNPPDEPATGQRPKVVVGIIDHGIALAHRAFVDARTGQSRLIALWDQDADRRSPVENPLGHWRAVDGAGYGGELDGATLDALTRGSAGRERWVYEQLRYDPAQRVVSHGTHVLDLAAGCPNPLGARGEDLRREAAAQASIMAVQLPYRPAKDSSGSGLCVHVLDALHYLARRTPKRHRLVVNLSDGAYGGPHDGQSMLERGIDRFLARRPWVTLVLAAGNARETRGHARFAALAAREQRSFGWRLLPDDATDSFLEVWFARPPAVGAVALKIQAPGAGPPITVTLGESVALTDGHDILASVISCVSGPDSPARSMFLVAVAPTRPGDASQRPAPHGAWQVTVLNRSLDEPVDVDAWVERDNPVFNESGPRRQSFIEADPGASPPAVVDGQGTLGSLAGSREAFVVGGHLQRGRVFLGSDLSTLTNLAPYSSRGPGRAGTVPGPDVIAPSDESPVVHGLLAAGNRTGAMFRMDGTSVAAPIVTRRIVNLIGSGAPVATRASLEAALRGRAKSGGDPDMTGERLRVLPGSGPLARGA